MKITLQASFFNHIFFSVHISTQINLYVKHYVIVYLLIELPGLTQE